MKKVAIIFFISICLLSIVVIFWFIRILIIDYKDTNENYDKIEIGDSINKIERLFGQPHYIEYSDTLHHSYKSPYNKYVFIYKDSLLIRKWKER